VSTPSATPVRPRLGPRGWAIVIPAGLVVVLLLVGILATLLSVRNQLTQQNQRTRLLIQKADPTLQRAPNALDTVTPLLKDAAPVLKASRAAIPRARRTARATEQLVTTAQPVVTDLASVVAVLPPLLDQLTPLARDLAPVATQLRVANLPPLLSSVRQLAETGSRALPALGDLANEVRRRELLRRASRTLTLVGRIAALQTSTLQANRVTLTSTKHIEDLFVQSLQVQRELLVHVDSIDRKFGGSTAPALVP
jgi:hypothetical protein